MARCKNNCGNHGISRRHFLFGGIGAIGGSLLHTVRSEAQGPVVAKPRNTAKACIFINLAGAPSHLDTFDAKEGSWNAADLDFEKYSGGVMLSRKFYPMLSGMTGDLLFLHSVSSWEAVHQRGQFYMQTNHSFNPAFAPVLPHIGAVAGYEKMSPTLPLPPFFSFSPAGDEQRQGFLPGTSTPFTFFPNTNGLGNLQHNFWGNQSQAFFDRSFSLMQALDAPLMTKPLSAEMAAYSQVVGQARQLIYNDAVDRTFKFSLADQTRYGNTNIGRGLIVARNLIQSKLGAVFISVTHGGWDLHSQQFNRNVGTNLYTLNNDLDRALGNLISDLRASGDLSTTLIVALGEFGRTPGPLNSAYGRDHYMNAMSALLLGGGIRGGRAIGTTDATGSRLVDFGWSRERPIYIEDIVSTIYSALGIDWTKSLDGAQEGRRYYYVLGAANNSFGPIEEVFA